MVNDLRELMRDASGHSPHEDGDLTFVLRRGRRRLRLRRAGIVGGTALAAGAISLASIAWLNPSAPDLTAAGVPRPEGHSVRLTDARPAVEGTDYRVLTSYTNENLVPGNVDADNGQYFDGVTDDGLVLFRDGPRAGQPSPRYALMDPATGVKDWLPRIDAAPAGFRAVELTEERLVLVSRGEPAVQVFDRQTRQWSTITGPSIPKTGSNRWGGEDAVGPDGRVYLPTPTSQGAPPVASVPTGPDDEDGDGEDGPVERAAFDLWSVSPTDATDIRDEHLRVGSIGFTDDSLVWTDSSTGAAGQVHVRNLTSGVETSFDPLAGERCNLLGMRVAGEHIAMWQSCGTYDGVTDARVQVVTTDGEQVVTVQDSGLEDGQLSADGDFLTLIASGRAISGTYVYNIVDGQFIRISDERSSWLMQGGPIPDDLFFWSTPAGAEIEAFGHSGATTWLGELL